MYLLRMMPDDLFKKLPKFGKLNFRTAKVPWDLQVSFLTRTKCLALTQSFVVEKKIAKDKSGMLDILSTFFSIESWGKKQQLLLH